MNQVIIAAAAFVGVLGTTLSNFTSATEGATAPAVSPPVVHVYANPG